MPVHYESNRNDDEPLLLTVEDLANVLGWRDGWDHPKERYLGEAQDIFNDVIYNRKNDVASAYVEDK